MKKGRFLWSAHRITEKQKAGKARNIKEKQLKNSRNMVSRLHVVLHSSQRDNLTETQDSRKARFYKGYRGCGKLSDVLDFKRYATHMQQVCNTNINDMYRTFSEKSGNVLSFCAFLQAVHWQLNIGWECLHSQTHILLTI